MMKNFLNGFIKENSVVIFPTDTVFGMGCLLYDEVAINKIYEIKGRDTTKELAVLCNNIEQVKQIAILDKKSEKLAKVFWPGALTIILKTSKEYYKKTGKNTIGVRIPNNEIALMLTKNNGPLKTTSVNKANFPPLNNINEIKESFSKDVDFIYEEEKGNYLNLSSTTIDLTTTEVKFIRIGSILEKEIMEVYNE